MIAHVCEDVAKEELLVGLKTGTNTMEINLEFSQKIGDSCNYTAPTDMHKICYTISEEHVHYYVHSSLICNIQKL